MPRFLSLSEAVAELVRDGMSVALEGFTHLIPFAATLEQTEPPTETELRVLRDLQARTARAHGTATT